MQTMMMTGTTSPERLARELDWNLLRTFLVLAQSRSVTDAADRLNLKQPSVSSALKRLEDRLGKRLIDRGRGRFELTAAGRLLQTEATDIHGAILRLGPVMREAEHEVRGHVSIGMASHVVCPLLDATLNEFHCAHPAATLSIDIMASREAIEAVNARRASFGICLVNEHSPSLRYCRLFREYFGLFCGPTHPLFGRDGLTLAALNGQASVRFVTDRMTDALRAVTLMRNAARLGERVVGSTATLEEVRRLTAAGLGSGPLPIHVVKEDVAAGRLWRLPPYDDPPAIDVHVAWNPRTRSNTAEQAMLNRLLETIERTPMEDRIYI